MKVLRLYHSAVVDEYRQRERMLRVRHGHDVQVVGPAEWPEGGSAVRPSCDEEVPVHVVPIRGPLRPNLFWYRVGRLRRILRLFDPEIVDLHEEPFSLSAGSLLVAMALERTNAKLCVYSAQNLPKQYPPPFSFIEARVLRKAGAAYPCSTEAGERLRSRGFSGEVRVLPLGVTIPPLPVREPGPRRVGFVSRLEPYKGGMLALRAFAAAASQTDAVMEILGSGSDEQALKSEASAAGIEDRVTFTGAVPQAEALRRMGTMDVVLVPSLTTKSWKEQFGRVPAQAMAHGAVVIASDSGSLREVVDDAGVLVGEGDQAALSAELARLLAEPARLAELRTRGRQRAEQRFSWEAISDEMDALYRQLVRS
jgi:glycosyltransferase involved in cell wall biosynthesis